MLTLFYRLILRPLWREPARALLTLFAVTVGVSVVLAIEMAGSAAAGSFRSSIETMSGKSNLEVVASGGVSQELIARIARLPYPIEVSPRIEDYATVVMSGQTVPLIGIDMISAANEEAAKSIWQEPPSEGGVSELNDPDSIWVSSGFHRRPGDKLRLLINDREHDYVVRGVIPASVESVGADELVVFLDIGAAQAATGKRDNVDRILVRVPEQPSLKFWQERIQQVLPAGVTISPRGSQTDANRRMLQAFRWNLRILSYVALLVGAFLIYNTISVSVVRRRHEIGIVRALGATRKDVLLAFVAEAACFGIIGSILAIPFGRLLANVAVRLLSATVDALYITSRPGSLTISASMVVLGIVIGMAVSIVSAWSPAREAAAVTPLEAMARARRDFSVRIERGRDLMIAVLLAIIAGVLSLLPPISGKPFFGYAAALALICAAAMATPAFVYEAMWAASVLAKRAMAIEPLIAARSLAGSLRRTAVLVGALSTAIAMMTSVGIMVGSFRQTVITWMDSQLPADLYLRPAGDPAADRHPTISLDLTDRIARLPGVAAVDRFRAYELEYEGLPVTVASAETQVSRYYRSSGFLSGRPANDVIAELRSGANAIVSEPFANKHHVKAGDVITLPLGAARVALKIVDVYYDYSSEKGIVILDRSTMLKYIPDPAASNLAVYLEHGAELSQVRREIESAAKGNAILIFSNGQIRGEAIRIFDQTFAITYALEVIAVFVAIMGVAGALVSIVIDRRREFAVLRFLGASRRQLKRLILVEAGILGLLSNAVGLLLGIVLSLILIFVINKQSFGWTIQFHWPITVLLSALTGVYCATVLAGIYPARMAQRLVPIEVIHEE